MNVFVVKCGQQHEEASPELHRIFAIRNDAVVFIKRDIQEHIIRVRQHNLWEIRPGADAGPKRWNLEISLEDLGWREEQVWLLEKHKVL